MKQELVELLEAVCNKEKEVIKDEGMFWPGQRELRLTFFILTHIKGFLPDVHFESIAQLKESLFSNKDTSAQLDHIWNGIFKNYPGDILGIHNLVSEFHLKEHDGWTGMGLVQFLLSKHMLFEYSVYQSTADRIRMETVDRLARELNLPVKKTKILAYQCQPMAVAYLLENFSAECQYVFVDCGRIDIEMLQFFFDEFKNIQTIEGGFTQLKEICGDASFDYAYVSGNTSKKDFVSMKSVLPLITDNGMAICVGQSQKDLHKWGVKEFNTYRTPMIFEGDYDYTTVLCVKSPATNEKICYFSMSRCGEGYYPYEWIINAMVEDFHLHKNGVAYIEVTKEDFLYNKELDFKTLSEVREGKENYVWKSIDDVLELRNDDVTNMSFDVDDQCIVTKEALSDNPFDLQLNTRFHLNTPNGVDKDFLDDVKYVHSGFRLVDYDKYTTTYQIAQHEGYQKDFYNAFDSEKCTDKELGQFFSKLLTSRMIIFDAILRCGNKFRIVHASEKHPVCLQFFQIEKNWIIGDYHELNVANNMQVYAIKEGYDAEHILHEIMTRGEEMHHYNHPDIHFLVAPDITIQKADYAKKKENYIKDLQRKRAEEEAELARLGVRNAVADLAHMLGTTFARQGSIMNTIRLLKEKGLPVTDEKMSSLMDSVNYVMRVVQNFGGDFEHTEFEWQNLNACELLKSYCTEWQNAMGKRFATEVYTNECDGTTIKTDPFYLKIMLDSIFENAWRHGFEKNYTESNKVLIDLKQVSYKGRKYLLIRICNNGKPLSNDIDMDAYTTRGRFSETSGRSGLGGNHVYQIVKKHEGYMSIDGSDPEWPFAIEILLPIFSFNNVDVQHYDKSCL